MLKNYLPSYGDYLLSVLDFLAIILAAANVTKFREKNRQDDSPDSYFVTFEAKYADKIEIMIWPDNVFVMQKNLKNLSIFSAVFASTQLKTVKFQP